MHIYCILYGTLYRKGVFLLKRRLDSEIIFSVQPPDLTMVAKQKLKNKESIKQSHLILITNKEIFSFALTDAAALT